MKISPVGERTVSELPELRHCKPRVCFSVMDIRTPPNIVRKRKQIQNFSVDKGFWRSTVTD